MQTWQRRPAGARRSRDNRGWFCRLGRRWGR